MVERFLTVDVSSHQDNVTDDYYRNLANKGVKRNIIKVSESTNYKNPLLELQAKAASNAGMSVDGYHFARFAGDINVAIQEANYALVNAQGVIPNGNMIALDYEDSASASKQANTDAAIAFMHVIEEAGYVPTLYSYLPFIQANIDYDRINQAFPNRLWIAGYTNDGTPNFNYFPSIDGVFMWQFTSNYLGMKQDASITVMDWPAGDGKSDVIVAPVAPTNDVEYMRQYGYVIWNHKQFNVDDRGKINGIWQVVSNELGGLKPTASTSALEWLNNGVPMAGVNWTDGTPQSQTDGKTFELQEDKMDIIDYDVASNGIAVLVAGYKVWVDATVARNA